MYLYQFFRGGTWLEMERGGSLIWIHKHEKQDRDHWSQNIRRFPSWWWTPQKARSRRQKSKLARAAR